MCSLVVAVMCLLVFFFFQAEDGIRDWSVTGVQTCALPISCGTWSLAGVELGGPVLTEASREAGFTNEAGVDGTVRFLRNVMGLRSEERRVGKEGGGRWGAGAVEEKIEEEEAGGAGVRRRGW